MNILDQLKKPAVLAILALIVGVLVGLLFGYVLWPVEWVDAPVDKLRADLQTEYLRMAIDSYAQNEDVALLESRYKAIGLDAPQRLAEIISNPGAQNAAGILKLNEIASANPSIEPTQEPGGEKKSSTTQTIIIIGAVMLVVAVLAAAGFYLLRNRRSAEPSPAQQARALTQQVEKTDFQSMGAEPPIAQYVTTYVLGDDLFDDSFSIDSPSGEFLGECGVGISETIGVGDPKKVTAFEVWMFDKNDIQTVTKVLMSTHAFTDPNLRAKLESKGELFKLEPGKQVVLETATLQMVAQVADMQFGQGALPNESFVDRLTLELAIWPRK